VQLVFSTRELPPAKRYDAWREALCDHYVHVDSVRDTASDYDGFIREAGFGAVTVTDCLLSPQTILRRKTHLAHLDKDCYYLALMQKGCQKVEQHGRAIVHGPADGIIFSAAEPYILSNTEPYRAIYLEFPRAAFTHRGGELDRILGASINLSHGLGRVIGDLCGSMVLEADSLEDTARARLGEHVLDMLALAVDPRQGAQTTVAESSVQAARLRLIRKYIEAHLASPLLNPERVAHANQISVRALHYLFKSTGQSVSAYIWERRLQRSREELELSAGSRRSVTEIALACGFNSMSHFGSMFRRRFGATPSELRASVRVG
jgi:AraC-like DNA-binding protein